jgi:hypothetical protein
MSDSVHIVEQSITAELAEIGVVADTVSVQALDQSHSVFIVKIVSSNFDGFTYLDREMRVRPAVARALSRAGLARSEFVIEPLSPDDSMDTILTESEEFLHETTDADTETPVNRARWRTEIEIILKALRDSSYELTLISESLYRAKRTIVSDESLIIAFARSVTSKTIDVDIRKSMQMARDAERTNESYYISALPLASPFANQRRANWIKLSTTTTFLHLLNASQGLAKKLSAELADAELKAATEHRGPVIEPDTKDVALGITRGGFFAYTKEWLSRPGPSLLVVMAPAGHGKTTLCHELSRRMAASFLTDGPPRLVPVMVPFESVRRVVDFESLLYRRLGELRPGSLGAFLPLLHRGEAVLIVDGFDELANDAGFEVAENQVRSMKFLFAGHSRVVLAGRSLFTEDFAESTTIQKRMRDLLGDIHVDVVEILPFDQSNITEYAETRRALSAEQRKQVCVFSTASLDHEQLCSNPLFLKMLCTLAIGNSLPRTSEVETSVQLLIRYVCEREEMRQHLGIGTEQQLSFLRWIASEVLTNGKGVIRDDVQAMAELLQPAEATPNAELVGRLLDHALLDRTGADRIDIIHPYIRDVLIGESVLEEARSSQFRTAGVRDLPEATVRHVASAIPEEAFPKEWLSAASLSLSSRVRRNLFRVAVARAVRSGDPRSWMMPSWLRDSVVRSLDLSGLRLKFLSLDDLAFQKCDFSRTILEECDLRAVKLYSCTFTNALLQDCRFDREVVVDGGAYEGAAAVANGRTTVVDSLDTFRSYLAAGKRSPESKASGPPQAHVQQRVNQLITACLSQFVQVQPVAKFFVKNEDELVNCGDTHGEQLAVDKVIGPGIYKRLCSVRLAGGSEKLYELDKRYHSLVVDFFRTGQMAPALSDILGPTAMRAARFLS